MERRDRGPGLRKGYLAQELTAEQLAQSVPDFCRSAPSFGEAGPRRLARAAAQVGLDSGLFYDWRPMHTLSGGQRAKLLFLSMVLRGCNVLLLDEPTRNFSPLSAPVIREVLAGSPGCIISVSHDRQYLSQVCTRVLELAPSGLGEVRL